MRSRPEDIVENLRDAAEMEAEEAPDLIVDESPFTEAADLIEWLTAALVLIKDGSDEPSAVASDALDLKKWRAADPALLTTEQVIARLQS